MIEKDRTPACQMRRFAPTSVHATDVQDVQWTDDLKSLAGRFFANVRVDVLFCVRAQLNICATWSTSRSHFCFVLVFYCGFLAMEQLIEEVNFADFSSFLLWIECTQCDLLLTEYNKTKLLPELLGCAS